MAVSMALDTASRGDFSSNTAAEPNMINNLAASNSNHCPEYDRAHYIMPVGDLGDENDVNEVLNGDTHSSKKRSEKVKKRDKPKIAKVVDDSHI
ncbi:unnamed protein product, partial [Arabidopsis halleri]